MSRKPISYKKLSDTLSICECHKDYERPQGFWIYDETVGANLAMGNPDRDAAFVEVIAYHHRRYADLLQAYLSLKERVDGFLCQFPREEED